MVDNPSEAAELIVAGCRVVEVFTPGQSFRAIAPGGWAVVLKRLDPDCLFRGTLHPNVRDRLNRVRELAHPGVAHLYEVQRDPLGSFLLWQFVEGQSVHDWAATLCRPEPFLRVARDIVLSVEALHTLGIVHGAIHGGNVIIDPAAAVKLTHISPLLYDDPAQDVRDVAALLLELMRGRTWADVELVAAIDRAGKTSNLAELRSAILNVSKDTSGGPSAAAAASINDEGDGAVRARPMITAIAVAVVAVVIAGTVAWHVIAGRPRPPAPPVASAPADGR